jgi:hypothetical protein
MPDKASPAGWIVQVTVLAVVKPRAHGTYSREARLLDAPTFRYFNVAVAEAEKAVEATRKHSAGADEGETCVARRLSSEEIAALRLKPGEVRPA